MRADVSSYLKKIGQFFSGDLLTKILKNSTIILSGNSIAWVIGFISFSITALILGPENYGTLVLITAYAAIIGNLTGFQSWQGFIKFGTDALERNRTDDILLLTKFCLLLDVTSGILGFLIALGALSYIAGVYSWTSTATGMAALYILVILFRLSGTPTGILRLFNRFDLLASQQVISAIIKVIGIVVVWILGGDLFLVLLLYLSTDIIGNLILLGFGLRELRIREYRGFIGLPHFGVSHRFPGIWSFILSTNLSGSIKLGIKEADLMIVGLLLGPAAVGIYKVAKQFGAIPAMLTDPIYQVVYPDLARLWSRCDFIAFRRVMVQVGIIGGGAALVILILFIIFGESLLAITVGAEYISGLPVVYLYLIAMMISVAGVALGPAMLSMGKATLTLVVQVISTALYLPILYFFCLEWGIIGAGLASIAFYLLWAILMMVLEIEIIRKECKIHD